MIRVDVLKLAVSGFALAVFLQAGAVSAQESAEASKAATPAPTVRETLPIDPQTGMPFPSLAEVSARTPPSRAMTQEEEIRWKELQSSFAELLSSQKLPEAIEQAEAILELEERTLGPIHPEVLGTLSGLTQLKAAQGRYAQAEAYARRALELSQALLGERHPNTITSMNN